MLCQASAGFAAITSSELLGRPTDTSVVLNAVADEDLEAYVEYGTTSGTYAAQTATTLFLAGVPIEISIDELQADTRYYYRLRYRAPAGGSFAAGDEHAFHTQRATGSDFVFAIQADSHLDENSSLDLYQRTLLNISGDAPDFLVDLGDTFMSEKFASTYEETVVRHLLQRPYLGLVAHSAPLFLVIGNHEGELGWKIDGTPNNVAVWATTARKLYYPNPIPNGFYTGPTAVEPFVGLRESYYAWQWGDALFVVLEPFWQTTTKPGQSGDNWDWTLGYEQYSWLGQTLAATKARFKFLFIHHLTGGTNTEGRGGIAAAPYYEWGGKNGDGTWGFDVKRPGWTVPIHQLLVENHVSVVFHGHDHLFVKETLDGIVYQETPQPSHPALDSTGNAAAYGYTTGDVISSSGHLRVSVSDTRTTVEYVRAYLPASETPTRHNGDVAYAYTIEADTDADGVVDAQDVCTVFSSTLPPSSPPDQNPARFLVRLRDLDSLAAPSLVARGSFNVASTTPAIDPSENGVHVRVADGAGVVYDASVPGGLRGTSPCDDRDGWVSSGSPPVKWLYTNRSGGLPDGNGGCAQGAAAGVQKVLITDRTSSAKAAHQFKITAKNVALSTLAGPPLTRLQFDLTMGARGTPDAASAQALAGQCAEFVIAGNPVPSASPKPYCRMLATGAQWSGITCYGP